MNNNKQSSVEYIIEQLKLHGYLGLYTEEEYIKTHQKIFEDIIERVKAMHKEEIKDAVGVGSQFDRDYLYGYHDKAEQYYNETFYNEN